MKIGEQHSEESKRRMAETRTVSGNGRSNICEAVFGKPHSELTDEEYATFRRLTKAATYYRRHTENVERQRASKQGIKQRVLQALGWEARCVRCGYDRYIGALDFHHEDPTQKDNQVLTFGFDRAVEEARKCILICSNCHREVHAADERKSAGRPRVANPLLERYLEAAGITNKIG